MARGPVSAHELLSRYSAPIYVVAALMFLVPPIEVLLNLQQYAWGNARWRFGALGLLAGGMLLPIAGLLLASVTAVLSGHRWVHRMILVLAAAGAAASVIAVVLFALDAIQVRREVNQAMLSRYDVAVVKTLIMLLAQGAAAFFIWRAGLRAGRTLWSGRQKAAPELVAGIAGR